MAIMLPVGPGGPYGDSSLQGAPESPPNDTTNGISSDGGANNDSSPYSTGTLSDTGDAQSFRETLKSTQQGSGSKPPAKNHKPAAAPTAVAIVLIPLAVQAQQGALGIALAASKAKAEAAAGGAVSDTPLAAASSESLSTASNSEPAQKTAAQEAQAGEVAAEAAGAKGAFDKAVQSGAMTAASAANAISTSQIPNQQSPVSGGNDANPGANDMQPPQAPSQTLAHADSVAVAAVTSQSKQNTDSHGGSSGAPQQMNWTAVGPGSLPPAGAPNPDAKVAGAGMAERIDVVRQIAAQLSAPAAAPTSGEHTVTISIHPDHWGALTINLTMNDPASTGRAGAGGITATIVAQSSAVRDALIGASKDLQNALESAGVKLQKLDIITAAAAAGTVAAGHSSSQAGFDTKSQNRSFGQQGQQSHSGSASQDASTGQQGRQPSQQFQSAFYGSGQDQPRHGWLPSIAAAGAVSDSDAFTPIGLVEATASSHAPNALNVLA